MGPCPFNTEYMYFTPSNTWVSFCGLRSKRENGLLGFAKVMIITSADHHLMRALPHVNPPPKAVRRTRSPGWMVPSRTASSRAMGTVAEEIFPYFSMFT
jgi:hypothetical protein